ncbi:MAG: DNA polymerase II large subunit [Nanoarchaeota archaeon]|nr:DNA polymerase II large subunit [Nanoarchaeota archaeon]
MSAINNHFKAIENGTNICYDLARLARKKGLDPADDVETPIATTLAEKAIGLISVLYPQIQDKKIIDEILNLEKEYGQLDPAVAFKIAEEIAKEKFCKFKDQLEAIDAGIRVGFSYITLGVVSSPIEGFTGLKIGKTRDGKEYFRAFFSGPIRSAGTTASCVVLMLIDYLRETFGYAPFDPDESEVKRYITENYDYHERVNNLQYLPTEEEIEFLAKRLPIQIDGEPTEKREVSNYKDLDRIETNFIRGGMCLIFSEGLAQKAQKGVRLLKQGVKGRGFQATGWDYLDEYIEKFKTKKKSGGKTDGKPTYIKDIVAGRPVFGHPSRSGAFRFRYGRSRTGGFSATLVHPATMAISNSFISSGTQLKIEKPTKGCAVTVCDSIDGPIVKLKNGSVKKLHDFDEAKTLYKQTEEILYFGDLLFPLGDVINRNYDLLKAGYVEEWWALELKEKGGKVADMFDVGFEEAVKLSKKFNIPLHPAHIYFWTQINKEEFFSLLDWIGRAEFADVKMVLPWGKVDKERFVRGKRALEIIGAEHEVTLENVVLSTTETKSLLFNLGFDVSALGKEGFEAQFDGILKKINGCGKSLVLEVINEICGVTIKDKAGTFIGTRMGRPEKAKLRKLTGSPHVLFPVGDEGGRLRSFQAAYDVGSVRGDFPHFYCPQCDKENVYRRCKDCGEFCVRNKEEGFDFGHKRIDIREYVDHAKKVAGVSADDVPLMKGVRGTSNADHITEFLPKGFLRAKHNLHVNKDGTIRYDMTEMAFTHFKPKEIRTSVDKLKELGYETDMYGKPLESDEQILELFPHDVVLPACPETLDEKADDVFLKISKFIDDELERLYGLDAFYKAKTTEDLVGHLVVCIAPHICTATVGRIIGFSKIQALLASPYMHAAMRRDCDGDEAAAMMLMDLLLNFSKKFLPAHRGGTQDSPLVLNTHIRAGEVDDQILDVVLGKYPFDLYKLAEQGKHSSEVKVDNVKARLANGQDPFTCVQYTHETSDFNAGVINSSYKILPTMQEKVWEQMDLCKKIRAVDAADVARLVIERHFIRDTRGNLRKFSMQGFRCVACNEKFRRPPLAGKCTKCGGKIIFTISEGSILKYMQPALDLARTYGASPYLLESLELTEMYIHSIFGKEKEKQESISNWF